MICRLVRAICIVAVSGWAGLASATPYPTLPGYFFTGGVSPFYPGDSFDWPAPDVAYQWLVDVDSVTTVPTTVIDFTVTNTTLAPLIVPTFQVFGQCTGPDTPWRPDFTLQIDGSPTPWTIIDGIDSEACLYHDLLNYALMPGATRFSVVLDSSIGAPGQTIDVRFGNIIPAIPLPATALLAVTGLAALGGLRRRQA